MKLEKDREAAEKALESGKFVSSTRKLSVYIDDGRLDGPQGGVYGSFGSPKSCSYLLERILLRGQYWTPKGTVGPTWPLALTKSFFDQSENKH